MHAWYYRYLPIFHCFNYLQANRWDELEQSYVTMTHLVKELYQNVWHPRRTGPLSMNKSRLVSSGSSFVGVCAMARFHLASAGFFCWPLGTCILRANGSNALQHQLYTIIRGTRHNKVCFRYEQTRNNKKKTETISQYETIPVRRNRYKVRSHKCRWTVKRNRKELLYNYWAKMQIYEHRQWVKSYHYEGAKNKFGEWKTV